MTDELKRALAYGELIPLSLVQEFRAKAHRDCLVRGLWWVEARAVEKGTSLTESPYRERLMEFTGAALVAEIRREINIAGKGGERVEGSAVLKWINKQRIGLKHKL